MVSYGFIIMENEYGVRQTYEYDGRGQLLAVKNADGKDSPETCRAALCAKWRRQLQGQVRISVPVGLPLEIDPLYMYDGSDILTRGFLLRN